MRVEHGDSEGKVKKLKNIIEDYLKAEEQKCGKAEKTRRKT
jgi:hypothetical protein